MVDALEAVGAQAAGGFEAFDGLAVVDELGVAAAQLCCLKGGREGRVRVGTQRERERRG